MSADEQGLRQRIDDLETRIAFQEHALNQLSDALAECRNEQAQQALALERVLADLRQLRTMLYHDAASEPPPPHW